MSQRCKWKFVLLALLAFCSAAYAQTSVGVGGGGSMYAPAVAPYNSNIMFVSCDMSALYRSMDGGLHWTMMDERTVQSTTSFSVAFDPTTPGHIIGYHPSLGMRESFDTGNTWSAFSPGSPGSITAAAFSTDSPTKLVVGTSSGVYVLQNGAWQAGPTGFVLRVIFVTDPSTGHQVAYATNGGNVYQLSASGTWNTLSSGLPIGGAEQVTDIAGGADAAHFALYATISTASGQLATSGGVYRYASNNPTWTRQVSGLNGGNGTITRDPNGDCDTGTDPQYQLLGVAAAQPDTAYVTAINTTCGNDVYKGTFSGSMNWSPVYDGFQNHPTTTNLTPGWIEMQPPWGEGWGFGGGAHGFTIAPGDVNTVVYVNNAAVHVTTNGAAQWIERYTTLAAGTPGTSSARWQTTGLDVTSSWNYYAHPDPNKAGIHLITNTDMGLSRSVDTGSTWVPNLSWNTFYQLAFEYPAGPRIWAAVSSQHDIPNETQLNKPVGHGAVLVSSDDGASWTAVSGSGLAAGPVVSLIYRSGTLYASVWGAGVYSSVDGGSTWTQVGSSASFTNKHVYQLRFDASGSLYVTVSADSTASFVQGGLYKLVGNSWTKLSTGLETLLQTMYGAKLGPFDFSFDPFNSDLIYLCTGNVPGSSSGFGVYKYSLSAGTWTDMGLRTALTNAGVYNDSSTAFAPFPINGTLYVTTLGNGIWQSTNGGSTWSEYTAIPFLSPQRIVLIGSQIYITTFGGGVWKPGSSPPPPPTVNLTSPASGASLSGTITLSATASDPSGIAGVQFLVDNVAVGAEVTTSPYSTSFNTNTIADGIHTFSARARNTGNITNTSSVTATVSNGPPTQLTLTGALALSPASPVVNQSTTATFTVKNTGTAAITVQSFVAAARDSSSANVDFPASGAVTLQAGQSYTYSAARSFATAGGYTTWPSWFDGTNWFNLASSSSFTVQSGTTPGVFTVSTPMALSPASPAVNQSDTATFTVTNTGGSPITAQNFLVGARTPSNANVDFPASAAVTLQPGQSFTYSAARTFATAGTYSAWPSYFDGTNWFQLATPVNFTVTQPALFTDNFNRTTGLGSNWSVLYGTYTTNGTMAVSGTPPSQGNWARLTAALGTTNYSVAADVIVPAGSLDSGLVARSSDSANVDRNLYSAQIATDGNIYLYRRNEWNWTQLSSVAAGIVANTSYNLKLIVTGSSPVHLEVWLNGTQKIVFNDSSTSQITTGVPGLVNYNSGVKYDNFTVTAQ